MTDRLGRLPVLGAIRSWLNSWRGIGDVERGMARQGYDLQLTRYDARGWRATLSTPQKLIAQGTDWRFLNELKKELKG